MAACDGRARFVPEAAAGSQPGFSGSDAMDQATAQPTGDAKFGSKTTAAAALLLFGVGLCALPAWPQNLPTRPIHLIVGFAPGGTGDIVGRLIGSKLPAELGQPVVVENRPGAGGTLAARDVANAAPDGATMSVAQTPEIAINPYFLKDAGYDPLKDLQPIALAGVVPLALAVPANAPYSTMAELVAFLRSTDKTLTFASAGVGTPGHIAGELMKLKLNNRLTHVPYKGAAPALNDIVGGHVDFYFPGFPAAVPLMQGGKIKLLAVSSGKRSPVAPDIPTVAESTGIANFDFSLWVGFFAPRGTPKELATNLNAAINKVLLDPAIKSRLEADGAAVSALSIEQFTDFVRAEIGKYRDIIAAAGLKAD
jgi:tripartite-type tricarboxylate transporter receptor subunit TctC